MEVDMLKEMFPQFSGAVVEAVFDSVGRDIETASTLLLAPSFDPSIFSPPPTSVVTRPREPERRKKRSLDAFWTGSSIDSFKTKLVKMWEEERGVDVALQCTDGVSVWAHKLVLRARCPYLSVLLMSDVVFEASHAEDILLDATRDAFLNDTQNTVSSHTDPSTGLPSPSNTPLDSFNEESALSDWKDKCVKINVEMSSAVAKVILKWMYTDEFDIENPTSSPLIAQIKREEEEARLKLSPLSGYQFREKEKKKSKGSRFKSEQMDEKTMEMTMLIHQAASELDLHTLRLSCEFSDHLPPSTFAMDFLSLLYGDPSHEWSDLTIEAGGQDEGEDDYDRVKTEDGTWEAIEEEEKLNGAEAFMALPMPMCYPTQGNNKRVVFYAHKLILSCASEYFEDMFGGRWVAEKKASRVLLPDLGPISLQRMLESIYTNGRVRMHRGLLLMSESQGSEEEISLARDISHVLVEPMNQFDAFGDDSVRDFGGAHAMVEAVGIGRSIVRSRPCGLNENNALPTFIVANKYGVRSLESKAEEEMERWVDDSNVYPLISQPSLALSPSSRLYRYCIEYAARRYDPQVTEHTPDWALILPKDQKEIQSSAASLPLRFALSLLAHNMSAHERRKIAGDDADLEALKDTLANARAEKVDSQFYLEIFKSCLKDVFVTNFESIHALPTERSQFTFDVNGVKKEGKGDEESQNNQSSNQTSSSSSSLSSLLPSSSLSSSSLPSQPPSQSSQSSSQPPSQHMSSPLHQKDSSQSRALSSRKCPLIVPSDELRERYSKSFPLLDCPSLAWGSRAHLMSLPDASKSLGRLMMCGESLVKKGNKTKLFGAHRDRVATLPSAETSTLASEMGMLFSKVSVLVSDIGAAASSAAASIKSSSSSPSPPALLRVSFTPNAFHPPPPKVPKAARPGRLAPRASRAYDNGLNAFTKIRAGRPSPWSRIPSLPTLWEIDTYKSDHPIVAPKKKILTGKWDESELAEIVETLIFSAATSLPPQATPNDGNNNPNHFGNESDSSSDDEDASDLDRAMSRLSRQRGAEDRYLGYGSDYWDSSDDEEEDYSSDETSSSSSGSDSTGSSDSSTDEDDIMLKRFGDAKVSLEMKDENSLLFSLSNVSFRLPYAEIALDLRAPGASTASFDEEALKKRRKAKEARESENDFFRLPWDLRAKIMAEARAKGFEGRIEADEEPVQDVGQLDVLVTGLSLSILFSFHSHPAAQLNTVLSSIIHSATNSKVDGDDDEEEKRERRRKRAEAAANAAIRREGKGGLLGRRFVDSDSSEDEVDYEAFAAGFESSSSSSDDDDDEMFSSFDDVQKMLDHLGISELGDMGSGKYGMGGIGGIGGMGGYGRGGYGRGGASSHALPFVFANDPASAAARLTSFKAEVLSCSIERVEIAMPETQASLASTFSTLSPSPAHPFSFWPYYANEFLPAFHVALEDSIRRHLSLPVSLLAHYLSVLSVKHHCRAIELLAQDMP